VNKKWVERLILALIYWLLISFAATASYLIADQIMRMLNTILVLEETHAASVIRLFLTVLISGAILAAVSYWEGYHFASFDKSVVFPAIGISLGVHFALGFLFGFTPWVTGGVLYLTGWIKYGINYTSECSMATKDISVFIFILSFNGIALPFHNLTKGINIFIALFFADTLCHNSYYRLCAALS
jgi:hypothetical protein